MEWSFDAVILLLRIFEKTNLCEISPLPYQTFTFH